MDTERLNAERDELARKHYDEYVEKDEENKDSLNWIAPRFSAFCYGFDAAVRLLPKIVSGLGPELVVADLFEKWKTAESQHEAAQSKILEQTARIASYDKIMNDQVIALEDVEKKLLKTETRLAESERQKVDAKNSGIRECIKSLRELQEKYCHEREWNHSGQQSSHQ